MNDREKLACVICGKGTAWCWTRPQFQPQFCLVHTDTADRVLAHLRDEGWKSKGEVAAIWDEAFEAGVRSFHDYEDKAVAEERQKAGTDLEKIATEAGLSADFWNYIKALKAGERG